MTRFAGLLLLLIACSGALHSEEIQDLDGKKYKCRVDDSAYSPPVSSNDIFHRYSVRDGCSLGENGGTPHDAICISSESDRIMWIGKKGDTITPKIKPLTNASQCMAHLHPFKYDPGSRKDFLVSGEADANYERCAYEVLFQCPSGDKGDPHIIIKSSSAQQLAAVMQRKSADVANLAKILNDKLKKSNGVSPPQP
jgi:hypothetical protein